MVKYIFNENIIDSDNLESDHPIYIDGQSIGLPIAIMSYNILIKSGIDILKQPSKRDGLIDIYCRAIQYFNNNNLTYSTCQNKECSKFILVYFEYQYIINNKPIPIISEEQFKSFHNFHLY